MRIPYFIWIAWRFLRARARQTLLTALGVVLGVTIVTVMQGYMGGFLNFFIERSLQSTPSVTVTQASRGLPNPAGPLERALGSLDNSVVEVSQLPIPEETEELQNPTVAERLIAQIPQVITVSPFVNGQGVVLNGDQREPINFIGVRPLEENRVTDLSGQIIKGSLDALAQRSDGIILGGILAYNLSADVGDRVTIISQDGISRRFLVVGIYYSQLRDVDLVRAYVNLRAAQQLMQIRGISGLGVRTTSRDTAAEVARRIEQETPYTAQSWREVNANVLDLFTTISLIIYLVVGFTMIVAGFGIANSLVLMTSEKQRDVGVLKALGVPARQITALFLTIGMFIGIFGILFGLLFGALGLHILANMPIPIQAPDETVGGLVGPQTFPVIATPRIFIIAAVFGFLVSVAAGVLPSLRAAKSDPIQVIRGAE